MIESWRFEVLRGAAAEAVAAGIASQAFQQPAWVRAVAAARGRPHHFALVQALRAQVGHAWLPGAVHRRFGLQVFESMPMGGYGGWVSGVEFSARQHAELTRAWLGQVSWPLVILTGRPGAAETLPQPAACGWLPDRLSARLQPQEYQTHLLDLSGDDAALLQRVRPRMRTYLKRVDTLGFEFSRGNDLAAMSDCHHWYRRCSTVWQTAPGALMPESFFTSLAGEGLAEAWSVHWNGRAVGAALFLVGRKEVQYQASGTLRIDSPVSAMESLLWHAARHYRDRGCTTLNLGASDGLEGVARFKHKFGARAVHYMRVSYVLPRWRGLAAAPVGAAAAGTSQ